MAVKGGVKAAADMLTGLNREERDKVIKLMEKKDSTLCEHIQNEMVSFEDLRYLTTEMIRELLKDIKLDDLGLALKIGSHELRDHFLSNLSKGNTLEIMEILSGPKKSLKDINDSISIIMKVVRDKIDSGQIILDKNSSETYV